MLTTAWWLPKDCMKTAWWLPYNYLTTTWQLHNLNMTTKLLKETRRQQDNQQQPKNTLTPLWTSYQQAREKAQKRGQKCHSKYLSFRIPSLYTTYSKVEKIGRLWQPYLRVHIKRNSTPLWTSYQQAGEKAQKRGQRYGCLGISPSEELCIGKWLRTRAVA